MGKHHRSYRSILLRFLLIPVMSLPGWMSSAQADYYPSDSYFPDYSYSYMGKWGSSSGQRSMVSIDMNPKTILDNAFRVAAREDRVTDLIKLLEKGVNVNTKTANGMTPLMYAARNCSPKMAEVLLRYKADVNAKDVNGRTPLIYASRESCWRVVELLVKVKGLQPLLRDTYQKTALDYASDDALLEVGGPAQRIMGLILFSRR